MSRRLVSCRRVFLVALGVGLAACSLDSDLPGRNGSAAPENSGVMLSGAGAPDAVGTGEGSRISDRTGTNDGRGASAEGVPEDIDSSGDFRERAGNTGGAGSGEAGAAGAAGAVAGDDPARTGLGALTSEEPPVLWFSEYVEGSSTNKALEITAQARSVLAGCKVSAHFNGKSEATVIATLSGVLEAGQVLTLCTSALAEKLADTCDQVGNLTFNGDDGVSLSCAGKVLDVIGQLGVDPGDAWGTDPNTTAEHTLRRRCSVRSGDPLGSDPFDPSTEWQAYPVDTLDDLGRRGC
jgi:hypothetical protein